jgi:hypothetical protein
MKTQGKFILMTIDEFAKWLDKLTVTRKISNIQNHHTYIPNYKHFKNDHFARVEAMEYSHMHDRNPPFSEIAQTITTFPDGLIMICRSFNKAPAGIYGSNAYGICVEHLGNFNVGGDTMTEAHKKTIIKVNALLCKKFNLAPSKHNVIYHCWFNMVSGTRDNENGLLTSDGHHKTCPGSAFFGGNTVAMAEKYFIPEVLKEMG